MKRNQYTKWLAIVASILFVVGCSDSDVEKKDTSDGMTPAATAKKDDNMAPSMANNMPPANAPVASSRNYLPHNDEDDIENSIWAAAAQGNTTAIQSYITAGRYINAVTVEEKTTPLMVATFYGQADVVSLLLENNADTSLMDSLGYTAQDIATKELNKEARLQYMYIASSTGMNVDDAAIGSMKPQIAKLLQDHAKGS